MKSVGSGYVIKWGLFGFGLGLAGVAADGTAFHFLQKRPSLSQSNRTSPLASSTPINPPLPNPSEHLMLATVKGQITGIEGKKITFLAEEAAFRNRKSNEKVEDTKFIFEGKELFDPETFRQFPAETTVLDKLNQNQAARDGEIPVILFFTFECAADGQVTEGRFVDLK